MKLFRSRQDIIPGRVCLAIGMFDGVHLGHQQVIRQTIGDARHVEGESVVVTFDRHPNSVVAPDKTPPLIYSLNQKLEAIAGLGVHATYLIRFDLEFSRQPAPDFVHALLRDFGGVRSICVGRDFAFGHKRAGNVALLQELGAQARFSVHALAAVSLDDAPVSSTRIREAIRAGQLDAASQMLGRPYSLGATVVEGDQLGRKLGFPTANLDTRGLIHPPVGVYAAHARIQGVHHRAVVNIGFRPTLGGPEPVLRVEAHLLGFAGDLYGQELEVVFAGKLREEQRFESLPELQRQIRQDVEAATRLLSR